MATPTFVAPALLLAALASSLPAQTPPCLADNDQSTTVTNLIYSFNSASPGVWAWQVTPTSTLVAQSLRIYTGNNYTSTVGNFMSLAVWDEDPSNPGQPGTRLAGGTWRINPTISWQGTNFDNVAVMLPNQSYWIVLTEPGWSTPPSQPGGTTMPFMSGTSGSWVAGNPQALKFRLYCGLLDDQGVVAFGNSCPSSSGSLGTAFSNGSPAVGNTGFRIEGTGFDAGVPILNALGLTLGFPSVPLPGVPSCFVSTTLDITMASITGTGNVRAAGASGHAWFDIGIPANPALQGFYFASQLVALDATATTSLPIVTSNAAQMTVY
jgi:hypothetical protein